MKNRYEYMRTAIAAVACCLVLRCQPAPPPPAPALASEWPLAAQLDRSLVQRLAANNRPDSRGAIGRNRRAYFTVAFQRPVTWSFIGGCLSADETMTGAGVHALEYAFERQNSDGSFQCNTPAEFADKKPNEADLASSAAFFHSELGRSLLILKESKWFQQSREADGLRARMRRVNDKAGMSLSWLLKQEKILQGYDQQATNRYFFDAMAFYLTGKALGRADAMEAGRRFAQMALKQQRSDGAFLEKGGFDSSYQAVSLLRATILYANIDPQERDLRQGLWRAIATGMDKELGGVNEKGQIGTEGNTRVFRGGEKFLGREKDVAYVDAALAFYYYAFLTGRKEFAETAEKVLKFYAR